MTDYKFLKIESHDDGRIVRVLLNRPDTRNAQNRGLLVELDDALMAAERDDKVRVVILGGTGPLFSSGHDMGSPLMATETGDGPGRHPSYSVNGGSRPGSESIMLQEWHYFFMNKVRWRNLRKIMIAQVHGPVVAAGLMLAWVCDLIVAAEGTTFSDVVATRLGLCGVEYFAHPWEFGPRKAKELLLTGDSMTVDEAYQLGMVSKVFPPDMLAERTLEFARRIARVPTMTALMVKDSVNQSVDMMGYQNALQACFGLHQLNHSHWTSIHGKMWPAPTALAEDGVDRDWRTAPPVVPAAKDKVRD